jgi:DUF1365 family protein
MQSCLYEGRVRHRRRGPVKHEFSYRLFMIYMDLDEAEKLFSGGWLWSTRRFSPARFVREDYLGDPQKPLAEAVRDLVSERLGRSPRGPVRLLTNLRYLGFCFNPISLYFCFADDGQTLDALVAEVSNTPWRERHCYVLDAGRSPERDYHFDKQMHVSPFLPMEMSYRLRFAGPGKRLNVQLDALDLDGAPRVDATLTLRRREISKWALASTLVRFPWITGQVVAAIYFQAWRLWLKNTPIFKHPELQIVSDEARAW